MKRYIMHIDMDAFFASVEQLDNPELKGKPLIVGGQSNRGVVSTCSYEARKYGVHSAMLMVEARRLCPHAEFLPGRMWRYEEVSREIMRIFHEEAPLVEQLSIDEAFLDVSGMERLHKDVRNVGWRIKERIKNEIGLTCSVGLAPNKFLAKMASDLQKNIAEPAFNGKKGSTFTVASGMGEQTFKIAEISKATPKVKLAILSRKVTASSKTYGALYNEAKQVVVANNNADSLRQAALAQGLTATPVYALNENSDKVNELKNSRAIVRWAFEAKEGQVSDVFECGDQFVVAALTEVNDGEYRPMEAVRAELIITATNDKKAEYIINQLNGVSTLEAAAELFDTEVKTAEGISLSSFRFGAAGVEPAVIGTALALEPNTMSAPVKGTNGVYVLTVGEKKVAEGALDATQEIMQLNMRTSYSLPYQAVSLIEEKAEVVDNRARFQ